MTREQCRGARGLLGWKQSELARRAGIAPKTLVDFERGQRETYRSKIDRVEAVLTKAGIVFVSDPTQGEGVVLKRRPASRKARAAGAASPTR